ncbi:MAG: hypothetical protein MJ237_05775 [bacterium]|nr:hypothetical protein [bacterium]
MQMDVNAEIVNQDSDYVRRKKNAAWGILSAALGKSEKWLRMTLGSKTDNKGMVKKRENIEELLKETSDNIAGGNGMLPEWREFYTYNEGEIDADYNLAMQALNDVLNNNWEEPENEIEMRERELAEYYTETINYFKDKFAEAKTAEEKMEIFDNETVDISNEFLLGEIVILLDKSINNEVNNEPSRIYEESQRNNSQISEFDSGTVGKSIDNISLSSNQGQSSEEINPNELNQLKNLPK